MGQTLSLPSWGGGNGENSGSEGLGSGSGPTHGPSYRFPAKAGHAYFAAHFIMGGEKFDSPMPESFLFGENRDLNYLGGKPVSFPYPPPAANEPTKTIRSQLNVRRDSVHFVLVKDDSGEDPPAPPPLAEGEEAPPKPEKVYRPQFTFDTDVRCAVRMFFFAKEEISPAGINFASKRRDLTTETVEFPRGANQVFTSDKIFTPSECMSELTAFGASEDADSVCAAIQLLSLEGDSPRQCHVTLCSIDRYTDDAFSFKAVKQKIFVDGLTYLLQEIYGLENKATDTGPNGSSYADLDDVDDGAAECVVCMSDLRDTIILPCRHLCLCNSCADSLRYQASNCPICRAPFRALLQLRAVQKVGQVTHPAIADPETSQEGIPPGYTAVSLMEAMNGPLSVPAPPPPPICALSNAPAGQHEGGRKKKSRSGKSSSSKTSGSRHGRSAGSGSVATSASGAPPAAAASLAVGEDEDDDDLLEEAEMGKDPPASRRHKSSSSSSSKVQYVNEMEKKSASGSAASIVSDSRLKVQTVGGGGGNVGGSRLTMDLVDEELANLDVAPGTASSSKSRITEETSLNESSRAPTSMLRKETPRAVVRDLEVEGDDLEEEEARRPEEDDEDDEEEEPEEDDAMVVNVSASGTTTRISLPGTPTSLGSLRSASASAVSQQDSASSSCASSAASTKQLLPQHQPRAAAVIVRVHPTATAAKTTMAEVVDIDAGNEEEEC